MSTSCCELLLNRSDRASAGRSGPAAVFSTHLVIIPDPAAHQRGFRPFRDQDSGIAGIPRSQYEVTHMHPLWRDLLTATSADIGEDGLPRFPESGPPDTPGCRLFDLSHLGLIAVQGADAVGFLQGQLSNDVRELSQTHVQWSSHCSQKGRMLANFLVMRIDDTIYLQLPRELVPDLLKRLRMFVLRSRVTLVDASDDLVRIALAGDCAADLLAARGLPVPDRDNGLALTDGIAVIRLSGPVSRFEVIGMPEALAEHWNAFLATATPANRDVWSCSTSARASRPSMTGLPMPSCPRWPTCNSSTGSASTRAAIPAKRSWRGCSTSGS
jgi:hypothetical protein